MRKSLLMKAALFVCSALFFNAANARVWRVNNTAGVRADFTDVTTAAATAAEGDTIYIEPSATSYGSITLSTKSLVFIGPGYLLNENTGLQLRNQGASLASVAVDSLASGSSFIGIDFNQFRISSDVDNITITRCTGTINVRNTIANSKISNLIISKSYVAVFLGSFVLENIQVLNCLINPTFSIAGTTSGLIRNNVFNNASANISNCYVSNNIFIGVGSGTTFVNSTVKYNYSTGNNLPAGNNNVNSVATAALIVNTGSTDGKFRLATNSPAINGGEPINGVTPDAGMFGTADPYVLSGVPPIPTVYSLTVPASIPTTATTINITFSTRSNN